MHQNHRRISIIIIKMEVCVIASAYYKFPLIKKIISYSAMRNP